MIKHTHLIYSHSSFSLYFNHFFNGGKYYKQIKITFEKKCLFVFICPQTGEGNIYIYIYLTVAGLL